jgi:hypothetical protein
LNLFKSNKRSEAVARDEDVILRKADETFYGVFHLGGTKKVREWKIEEISTSVIKKLHRTSTGVDEHLRTDKARSLTCS